MALMFRKFISKTTGQTIYAPAGRYSNFQTAVKKIVHYVRYNMPKFYVVHLTLTLKEASTDTDFLSKNLHRTLQFIDMRLKRVGSDFKYIAVKEIQKKRLEKYGEEAVHYHILCFYSKSYVFPSPADIAGSWRLGTAAITAPKLRNKLSHVINYIGKYIGKGYEYEALDFKKSFSASQVKQIYKLKAERLATVIDKYGKERAEGFKCTYRKVYEMVLKPAYKVRGIVLDVIEMPERIVKELLMEFPSEWYYGGICPEPF